MQWVPLAFFKAVPFSLHYTNHSREIEAIPICHLKEPYPLFIVEW